MGVHSELSAGGGAHNYIGDGAMGTLLANTRMPDLNILDCIYVNAHPVGPLYGPLSSFYSATKLDIIVAGTDPVAVD